MISSGAFWQQFQMRADEIERTPASRDRTRRVLFEKAVAVAEGRRGPSPARRAEEHSSARSPKSMQRSDPARRLRTSSSRAIAADVAPQFLKLRRLLTVTPKYWPATSSISCASSKTTA